MFIQNLRFAAVGLACEAYGVYDRNIRRPIGAMSSVLTGGGINPLDLNEVPGAMRTLAGDAAIKALDVFIRVTKPKFDLTRRA